MTSTTPRADSPFYRLAPFIQDYIYNHGWDDLRQVQIEACHVIFDTDAHLLIAAGTASGKTEAAFLPVLTELYQKPSATVGAMYIGPIKALINDQFDRLTDLLAHAHIPVWAWHGDVTQTRKKKLLAHPQGVLQITPESLESLLINKSTELDRIFGDLRYVIIDEIHAFIGTDRGDQILCQLARLAKITHNQARRIGLSATLGDYSLAKNWLRSDTSNPVIIPQVEGGQRKIQLSLEHFYDPGLVVRAIGDASDQAFNPYHLYLYYQSLGKKSLIFANGRTATESAIAALRDIATAKGQPDIYHVHHGSISAALRQTAEAAMRQPNTPAVTAATVTFEMGIDLGQLDRVIQLESPASVASFLQRLGRSGRRGGAAEMRFICAEDQFTGEETLPEQVPWQLLQCIAIIQLYLEEKWIEPVRPMQYPYSLLYHQSMSTLAALGELSPAALAQHVLALAPFRAISPDDFRLILRQLIELDHIHKTPEGGLIVGLKGEKIVRNFKFYAIFPDKEEYQVKQGEQMIGTIIVPPLAGDRFSLAGRNWQAIEVDARKKVVTVQSTRQPPTASSWRGTGGEIHTRVLQRMRQVLAEDKIYAYLLPGAKRRLQEARTMARDTCIIKNPIVPLEDGYCCIFPWAGSIAMRTLERFLRFHCKEALQTKGVKGRSPYFLVVNLGKCPADSLLHELKSLADRHIAPESFLDPEEIPKIQKYDEYIPVELLRKSYVQDYLNIAELQTIVRQW